MKRNAFTMVELIFVIVILGILAAVAIPRLGSTVNDANIAKGRSDVASIRSAIVSERQSRLLQGDSSYINKLHHGTNVLFDNNGTATNVLLQYGIVTKANSDGHWQNSADKNGTSWKYKFRINGADNVFTYNPTDGTFTCTLGTNCSDLTD